MKHRVALLMAGSNIHARMLLQALRRADQLPALIIDETGTPRAAKLEKWLDNDFNMPPLLSELINGTPMHYLTVDRFDGEISRAAITELGADYIISGGAGILKTDMLALPIKGVLNIHPGLLPEFRGVDPVLWSLWEGGPVGATLHLMSEGIDEGPILIRREMRLLLDVSPLEIRLACMRHGAELLVEFLEDPSRYPPQKQDVSRSRYFGAFPAEQLTALEIRMTQRLQQK